MPNQPSRVLIVAGSDSGGGAGIQADVKTVTMLGGYATTAITALTAQNTVELSSIHAVSEEFVAEQMELVLKDIGADAVKTGMLYSPEIVHTVANVLGDYPYIPIVVDPVCVSTSGSTLLQDQALEAMKQSLIPKAALVTPNIPEVEKLTGMSILDQNDILSAGEILLATGVKAVLIKGGHSDKEEIQDVLITENETRVFTSKRQHTLHTHGTGCTLASAIACYLAQGESLKDAIKKSRTYVAKAIKTAPHFGSGHGPLNHGCYL